MKVKNDPFEELRGILDSSDPFMTSGHRILKIKRPKKKSPPWVRNNESIKKFLIRVFPHMQEFSQRVRAGKWIRVMYLYYNQNWSRGQIAAELHMTYTAVDSLIRSLKRASKGLRTDTGRPAGKPRTGRPRKRMPV